MDLSHGGGLVVVGLPLSDAAMETLSYYVVLG